MAEYKSCMGLGEMLNNPNKKHECFINCHKGKVYEVMHWLVKMVS
jgi:hypothetical protein